jgi:hypothetical protein
MLLPRNCKSCGNPFIAIKETQLFCCRRCFKKDYYRRNREQLQYDLMHPVFPTQTCAFCGMPSELGFDPIKDQYRYDNWECPNCHVPNKIIWKYADTPNSYQSIMNILVSVQNGTPTSVSFNMSLAYATYL